MRTPAASPHPDRRLVSGHASDADLKTHYPVFALAEASWPAHKSDCSGFVRAVALAARIPLSGLANHLVDTWNSDPAWIKLGSDVAQASRLSEQGYLVVAGRKEPNHGHVVVIVPGRDAHGDAMGYWGRLGGIGEKDNGLNFAWKRADLAGVQYFATSAPGLRAKP